MTYYNASFLCTCSLTLLDLCPKVLLQYSDETGASCHTFAMLNLFSCEKTVSVKAHTLCVLIRQQ